MDLPAALPQRISGSGPARATKPSSEIDMWHVVSGIDGGPRPTPGSRSGAAGYFLAPAPSLPEGGASLTLTLVPGALTCPGLSVWLFTVPSSPLQLAELAVGPLEGLADRFQLLPLELRNDAGLVFEAVGTNGRAGAATS